MEVLDDHTARLIEQIQNVLSLHHKWLIGEQTTSFSVDKTCRTFPDYHKNQIFDSLDTRLMVSCSYNPCHKNWFFL